MSPYLIGCLITLWLVCAFLSYGMFLAESQREFPSIAKESIESHIGMSIFFAVVFNLIPFAGVGIVYLLTGLAKHGLLFINPHKD